MMYKIGGCGSYTDALWQVNKSKNSVAGQQKLKFYVEEVHLDNLK